MTHNNQLQRSVSFPKASKGQAVVKPISVPATFHYVDKLINTTIELNCVKFKAMDTKLQLLLCQLLTL